MKIRKAQKSDYKQLMKLLNGFVGENRYSKYDNDSFSKVLKSPSNYIYVIDDNEKLAGFVTFSVRYVVRYPKPIIEMDELYVHSDYRRQGLGKKLTQKVLDEGKKLNCHRLFIESHYQHKAAHQMYKKMGFTNYGYHFIKNL